MSTIFSPLITGSLTAIVNKATITGSLIVTLGITGSLLGTASFATTATSASFATTASFASFATTATSASFATTASFALNAGGGGGSGFPFSGVALITGSLIVFSTASILQPSQSGILFNQILSQSKTSNSTIYAVNITPTLQNTTASQTQTAVRVMATFTGSSSGSNTTNNIVDFGSSNAGSQFTVTDVVSGSIYMVNDVSGIPILEVTSDWQFNIWNYPTKIFNKSGSNITISGSLIMAPTSSFVFPLTASLLANKPTGSSYFSSSLLFIWNGTRYMSSSFV